MVAPSSHLRPATKVSTATLFAALDSAVVTRTVMCRWNGKNVVLSVDAAKARMRDLRREFELATNVRTTRQVWPGYDGTHDAQPVPDDFPVSDIPFVQRGHSIIVKGDASVSITDATAPLPPKQRADTSQQLSTTLAKLAAHRRRPAHERSLQYRREGNAHFANNHFKAALNSYTQAVNALPDDAKALSNRAAAFAALRRYKESLNDAERGLRYDPEWPKLWARKALAHFYLNEFDEAVASYGRALEADTSREDYRAHRALAQERGGSHERFQAKQAALKRAEEEARRRAVEERPQREATQWSEYESALRAWDEERTALRRERRERVAHWKRSTGPTNELDKPVFDHGRSVHVDIFTHLRGRCKACPCTMWRRDVNTMRNWSDTSVLCCEVCGCSHDDHEDIGYYDEQDPPPPRRPGAKEKQQHIEGVYAGVNPKTGKEMELPDGAAAGVKVVDDGAAAAQLRRQREEDAGSGGGGGGGGGGGAAAPRVLGSKDFGASTARELHLTEDVFGTEWGGRWEASAGEGGQAALADAEVDGETSAASIACMGYVRLEKWRPYGVGQAHGNDTSVLFCRRCGAKNDAHVPMRDWLAAWHGAASRGRVAAVAHAFPGFASSDPSDAPAWRASARAALRSSCLSYHASGQCLEAEAYE